MKLRLLPLLLILFISTSVFSQLKINDKTSLTHMKANLNFLASDELEGRETGTRGEILASMYIAAEFAKYGVTPFGDNGTYFQNIKLTSNIYDLASKIFFDSPGGKKTELNYGLGFLKSGGGVCAPEYFNFTGEIIFAGFGITAPEFKYDDYAAIDVKGKIVIVLPDEPYSEDNNYFNGTRPTRYATANAKTENAIKHGAAGIFFFPESWRMKFWETFKKSSLTGTLAPQSKAASRMIPSFVFSEESMNALLEGEEINFASMNELIEKKASFKPFPLKKKVRFELKDNSQVKMARNVVGLIEGTDPKLKNEYVLLSAHYDHEGIRNGVVYNGADDDGSGTVSVMEVARIMKENKLNKRSVVALLVTGEEKGLWGSAFAAENGSYIPNTVADINIDMDGREHPDSIHVIGSNKLSTEYYNLIKEVNAKTVKLGFNYKYDDPKDPQRFFYRSDHYNFALKGIPIVFFFDDMRADYHKPTDDVEKINFDKMLKVVKLSANVALRAANLNHRIKVDKKLE